MFAMGSFFIFVGKDREGRELPLFLPRFLSAKIKIGSLITTTFLINEG